MDREAWQATVHGDARDAGLVRVGKIPWSRKWQPTPVFLPEKSHGQRSLVGYSPLDQKELDTTERLNNKKIPS